MNGPQVRHVAQALYPDYFWSYSIIRGSMRIKGGRDLIGRKVNRDVGSSPTPERVREALDEIVLEFEWTIDDDDTPELEPYKKFHQEYPEHG